MSPDDAIQTLAERALLDTAQARQDHPGKRPTWAPAIPFPEELGAALQELKALYPRLKIAATDYGRLWAAWVNPRHCGPGAFAGFDLRSGKAHNGEALVKIRRGVGSLWWIGPRWKEPAPHWSPERQRRYELRTVIYKLGLQAILELVGSDANSAFERGARLAGVCRCCWRTLTDPTSIAFGIGPECGGFSS